MVKTFVDLIEDFTKQKFKRIDHLLRSSRAWLDVSDLPNIKENWDKKEKGEDKAMAMIKDVMEVIEEVTILTQGLDIYRIAKEKGIEAKIPEIDDDEHNDNEEDFHAD